MCFGSSMSGLDPCKYAPLNIETVLPGTLGGTFLQVVFS